MVSHDSIDSKELSLIHNHETSRVKCKLEDEIVKKICIEDTSSINKTKLNITSMFPKKLSCIYVYCAIVEPTFLGEQSLHLLDVIPMPHMPCKQGILIIYKRVNRNVIDNISILIADENG